MKIHPKLSFHSCIGIGGMLAAAAAFVSSAPAQTLLISFTGTPRAGYTSVDGTPLVPGETPVDMSFSFDLATAPYVSTGNEGYVNPSMSTNTVSFGDPFAAGYQSISVPSASTQFRIWNNTFSMAGGFYDAVNVQGYGADGKTYMSATLVGDANSFNDVSLSSGLAFLNGGVYNYALSSIYYDLVDASSPADWVVADVGSVSATIIPEPSAVAFIVGIFAMMAVGRKRSQHC